MDHMNTQAYILGLKELSDDLISHRLGVAHGLSQSADTASSVWLWQLRPLNYMSEFAAMDRVNAGQFGDSFDRFVREHFAPSNVKLSAVWRWL